MAIPLRWDDRAPAPAARTAYVPHACGRLEEVDAANGGSAEGHVSWRGVFLPTRKRNRVRLRLVVHLEGE